MECEAGNVSFPQPLAPCGTGLWLFLGPFLEGVKERTRKGRTGTPPSSSGLLRGRGGCLLAHPLVLAGVVSC